MWTSEQFSMMKGQGLWFLDEFNVIPMEEWKLKVTHYRSYIAKRQSFYCVFLSARSPAHPLPHWCLLYSAETLFTAEWSMVCYTQDCTSRKCTVHPLSVHYCTVNYCCVLQFSVLYFMYNIYLYYNTLDSTSLFYIQLYYIHL